MKKAKIIIRKKKNGLFDYKLIGKNGELLYDTRQGFETKGGVKKNIRAVAEYYCGDITNILIEWL